MIRRDYYVLQKMEEKTCLNMFIVHHIIEQIAANLQKCIYHMNAFVQALSLSLSLP